jgi:hypothetical protein
LIPHRLRLRAHAVTRIGNLVRRITAAGGATRTAFRDGAEAATMRVHAIGAKLKLRTAEAKPEAPATVLRSTGELADLAHEAMADAAAVLVSATSNVATAGTAAWSTDETAPPPGADTACSPTPGQGRPPGHPQRLRTEDGRPDDRPPGNATPHTAPTRDALHRRRAIFKAK